MVVLGFVRMDGSGGDGDDDCGCVLWVWVDLNDFGVPLPFHWFWMDGRQLARPEKLRVRARMQGLMMGADADAAEIGGWMGGGGNGRQRDRDKIEYVVWPCRGVAGLLAEWGSVTDLFSISGRR